MFNLLLPLAEQQEGGFPVICGFCGLAMPCNYVNRYCYGCGKRLPPVKLEEDGVD